MLDDKFKMPQSSYDELSKVIKAYGHFDEPAGLDQVSKFIGLHRTVISRNAGFLIGVGILEPGAQKAPTTAGRKLAHALEHNMPDEIRTWWREIVSGNDFLTRLLAAIRIRSGMDQQTLEAHIAYSAGQPKKPQFMTGARTIIDILRAAELIKEVDGKFISEGVSLPDTVSATAISPAPTATTVAARRPGGLTLPTVTKHESKPTPVVNIQININCAPADIPALGELIRKLVQDISLPRVSGQIDEPQD